jgi:hypothetical protein
MAEAAAQTQSKNFALLVSVLGAKAQRFAFDQDRVLVGRGRDADLRVEHAALSRAQFLLERGVGSAGEARFRITPYESTNPTFVNGKPAVEGTLMPGDIVAIGEVRVILERAKVAGNKPAAAGGGQIPPLRMALLGAVTLMALYVGYLLFAGDDAPDAGDLASAQTKLFGAEPEVPRCANPLECDTRAHDAYARAKKLVAQAAADPGNLYRASLEFSRAANFREQSGRPLADMADVEALRDQAKQRAEAEYHDATFRLSRAIAAGDTRRASQEASLLARIVPDEKHPYRVKLDAYRRTLPRPESK